MQISRLTPTGSGKSANCQQLRNPGANSLDLLNDPAFFYTTDIVKYFQNFRISFSHTNSIFSKNIGFSRSNTSKWTQCGVTSQMTIFQSTFNPPLVHFQSSPHGVLVQSRWSPTWDPWSSIIEYIIIQTHSTAFTAIYWIYL